MRESLADRASVTSYAASSPVRWAGVKNKLTRTERLDLWQLLPDQSQALAALAKRAMQLRVSVQVGTVRIHQGDSHLELQLERLL